MSNRIVKRHTFGVLREDVSEHGADFCLVNVAAPATLACRVAGGRVCVHYLDGAGHIQADMFEERERASRRDGITLRDSVESLLAVRQQALQEWQDGALFMSRGG